MGNLVLPQSVSIQLTDGKDNRIALPDVLDGEKERWRSMKNLLAVYRRARNSELGETAHIRDEWDGHKDEYTYNLRANQK
jgi:hypothetical protein